jgi:hypothetical protein
VRYRLGGWCTPAPVSGSARVSKGRPTHSWLAWWRSFRPAHSAHTRALTYSATVCSDAGVAPDSNWRMTVSGSLLACKQQGASQVSRPPPRPSGKPARLHTLSPKRLKPKLPSLYVRVPWRPVLERERCRTTTTRERTGLDAYGNTRRQPRERRPVIRADGAQGARSHPQTGCKGTHHAERRVRAKLHGARHWSCALRHRQRSHHPPKLLPIKRSALASGEQHECRHECRDGGLTLTVALLTWQQQLCESKALAETRVSAE